MVVFVWVLLCGSCTIDKSVEWLLFVDGCCGSFVAFWGRFLGQAKGIGLVCVVAVVAFL